MGRGTGRPGRSGGESTWSDARPAPTDLPRRQREEESARRRRVRSRLVGVLFSLVFLAGSAAALFAEGGYLDRVRAERQLRAAQDELFERAERIRGLRELERDLRSGGDALERIAREELNYVRDGEVTFLLEDRDPFARAPDGRKNDRP